MNRPVLSFSEKPEFASELTMAGKQLAASLGTEASSIMMDEADGSQLEGKIVLLKASKRISDNTELMAAGIARFAKKETPSVLLFGSTRTGREIAGKVAVRLRLGTMSDVRNLSVQGPKLMGERGVYAGKFVAKVSSSFPCLATVPFGAYPRGNGGGGGIPATIETFMVEDASELVKRVETRPKQKASVDLRSAPIIVSVGRGIRQKEDIALIEKLAERLGGAVGCSRPISSDLGWLAEEHHIGLTGVYVHPDLYVAVGISGQLQHVAGIKDSRIIVAINKDRQAPIFQVADYGVVGDLYQVVPAILKQLESGTLIGS